MTTPQSRSPGPKSPGPKSLGPKSPGPAVMLRFGARAISLLSLLLAGCGTTTPPGVVPGDFEAAPRDLVSVQSLTTDYLVHFGGRGYIARPERDGLDTFISNFARNHPESVRVALSGTAAPAQFRAVADILVADGIDPRDIVRTPRHVGRAVPRGTIALSLERAVAVQPNCPGWVDHISAPADNNTNPNFGCSDVSNLAAMIGDPHHLREGASNIYEDGERGAKSVANYRADKVKDLPPINESFTVVPSK